MRPELACFYELQYGMQMYDRKKLLLSISSQDFLLSDLKKQQETCLPIVNSFACRRLINVCFLFRLCQTYTHTNLPRTMIQLTED
jgi:hypothetical protein